ncbi:MAG TPA: S-formylglutathione hydrolase, partial [Hyphomonas sp.]|nr:S-formylglutathione hydrolase [Hyphomonas sp.]
MTLTQVSAWQSFGGTLSVHDHESALQNCTMRFAVYTPSQADPEKVPVL